MHSAELNSAPAGRRDDAADILIGPEHYTGILEKRMAEYNRRREERLNEQAHLKQQLMEELPAEKSLFEEIEERWELEERKRAEHFAEKQRVELEEVECWKKKAQAFSEKIKEIQAKAQKDVEDFQAEEASRLAKQEREKQLRKQKKAELELKREAYAKRVQQRRLSAGAY
jgi:hypothetical protein